MGERKAGRGQGTRVVIATLGAALVLGVGLTLGVIAALIALSVLGAAAAAPAVRTIDWRGFWSWWRLQTRPMGRGTAVASLNAIWPPLRRLLRPDYVWVNYPGTDAHKRAYFPPWVEKTLRPVFPSGVMRFGRYWGVTVSGLASAETLERSPKSLEVFLSELRRQFPNNPPIALAGRLPSLAAMNGMELEAPFTKGDRGTVCAMAGSAREAARLLGKQPADATLAVVGSKGFIGAKLVESLSSEFGRIVALDSRYEDRSEGENSVLYTNRPDDLGEAEAIFVLTPKGADMSSVVSHVPAGAIVADDTHPEMPVELRAQVEEQGATILKATLGDDRFRFMPPIPDFRHDDIPGCILEALVIVQRGEEVLESQERFNRAAEDLGFRARLAPHLNRTKPALAFGGAPQRQPGRGALAGQ